MAFCTACGTQVPGDVRFCTSCGKAMGAVTQPALATTPVTAQPQTAPPPQAVSQPQMQPVRPTPAPAPQSVQAAATGDTPPASGSRYAVMGVGGFIGTMLLFCIPIVGWIACIVMAFAAKNQNRRNFARAMLVFLIVGAVLAVAMYFVFSWVSEVLSQYANEITGGVLGDLGGLGDLGKIFDIIGSAGIPGQ